MVNVGRVIGSTRLGCQHITVHRTSASWENGLYKAVEYSEVVCPAPGEFSLCLEVINTPNPADVAGADVISGVNVELAHDLTFDAIVTVASAKDLQMVPEGDRVIGSMKFLTTERLHQTNDRGISDIVIWRGARYRVITITPNVDYGFYRSIGIRLDGDGIG